MTPSAKPELAVGSTIWRFEENNRVYPGNGLNESPIYREHWRPVKITGETSRSWIVGRGYGERKVPKHGAHPGFAFSEQEVDDDCWMNRHRYSVVDAVRRVTDPVLLREIADLIGWKPDERDA